MRSKLSKSDRVIAGDVDSDSDGAAVFRSAPSLKRKKAVALLSSDEEEEDSPPKKVSPKKKVNEPKIKPKPRGSISKKIKRDEEEDSEGHDWQPEKKPLYEISKPSGSVPKVDTTKPKNGTSKPKDDDAKHQAKPKFEYILRYSLTHYSLILYKVGLLLKRLNSQDPSRMDQKLFQNRRIQCVSLAWLLSLPENLTAFRVRKPSTSPSVLEGKFLPFLTSS